MLTQEVAHADIAEFCDFGRPVFADVISNGCLGEFAVIEIVETRKPDFALLRCQIEWTSDMSTGLSAGRITRLPLMNATWARSVG